MIIRVYANTVVASKVLSPLRTLGLFLYLLLE